MPCRDLRLYQQTGLTPKAGGADDQPLERLARMTFAGRVQALWRKMHASGDFAEDMTEEDTRLYNWLISEDVENG